VLAVIAFHAGVPWSRGGYLGVDVFFVLSGYLITSLLLVEWRRSGSVGVGSFWARRIRRLFPALLLLLLGVAAYAAVFAAPEALRELRRDALATLGYVANWRFIYAGHAGYFDSFAEPSPLRHLWSLAVEEQFYVVWPVTAVLLLRWRRSPRPLLVVAGAGAMASLVAMALLFHPGSDPSRAYYGTDARAHTILIGVILAVLLAPRSADDPAPGPGSRLLPWAGGASAAAVVWACTSVDGRDPLLYRGGSAMFAIATAAVIASVAIAPQATLARVLAAPWLRFVGAISYGLYLWHWPIVLVVTRARTGLTGVPLLAARVGLTFGIAFISWRLMELPVLRGGLRQRRPAALVPVALVASVAVLFVATVPARPLPDRLFGAAPPVAAVPAGFVKPAGPPARVLILGDSVAFTYAAALEAGRDYGLAVTTRTVLGCGIARGGPIRERDTVRDPPDECDAWPGRWRALVDDLAPDAVALAAGRWETHDRRLGGRWTHLGEVAFDTYLSRELDRAIALLGARGARVLLVTAPYFDGRERPDGGRYPEDDQDRVRRYNQLLRAAAARHPGTTRILDVGRVLSPHDRYARRIDGVVARTDDGVHVTAAGRRVLADAVLPELIALIESPAAR
jgi:peptidoglycan/LPS O-acetylase OafA/YrhL